MERPIEPAKANNILSDSHRKMLEVDSGICAEVIESRGYRTVTNSSELGALGFPDFQAALVPCLLIPIHGVDGKVVNHQIRPDCPRTNEKGKPRKYEFPEGSKMHLDVPPGARKDINDPKVPLWITEGSEKADSAVSRCLCCIALAGVWNFRGKNEKGGKVVLPDFESVALNDRTVYIAYDSDITDKEGVRSACNRLAEFLSSRGARVFEVRIPASDGAKVGLDDFFVGGGTVDKLEKGAVQFDGSNSLQEEVKRLAGLPALEYDRVRKEEADRLGVRVATLDEEVRKLRGGDPTAKGQGKPLVLPEFEPWDEPVDGEALLDDIVRLLGEFVVLPNGSAEVIALWVLHAHLFEAWRVSPKLALVSPEKRCGKTTLLSVIKDIVPRPLVTANLTSASLFRVIESHTPTLLIDEADSFLRGNEELRGVLNSSLTKEAAYVLRCVGDDFEPRQFSTWTPIVFAMIGTPPDTLSDRSIFVQLQRKEKSRTVKRYLRTEKDRLGIIGRKCARFASDNLVALQAATPLLPEELDDRARDKFEPLFAIADVCGEDWSRRSREVALLLAGASPDEGSIRVQLLRDIQPVIGDRTDPIPTRDLCEGLNGLEESPWSEIRRGKPLDANYLARQLKPFGVTSKQTKRDGENVRCYAIDSLKSIFRQYGGSQPATPLLSYTMNTDEQSRTATTVAGPFADTCSENQPATNSANICLHEDTATNTNFGEVAGSRVKRGNPDENIEVAAGKAGLFDSDEDMEGVEF